MDSKKFNLNQRQVNLVLYILWNEGYEVVVPNDLEYLNIISNDLKLDNEYREELIKLCKENITPLDSVTWLSNDLRAALWFDYYSHSYKRTRLIRWKDYYSDFQKNLITCFDLTTVTLRRNRINDSYSMKRKLEFINEAKELYNRVITTPQNLKWLSIENEEKILWAHSYLSKNGYLIDNPLFIKKDLNSYYIQVCASLDTLDISDSIHSLPFGMSLYKKEFIRKMRSAWSQKKFRDKKDAESAQEYFLTRRHMNKLKKLADEHGLSSKEYLQQLIDEAYNSIE